MGRSAEELAGEIRAAADSLPATAQQREAAAAVALHGELVRRRAEASTCGSDACVLELLDEADRTPWEELAADVDASLAALDLGLPNEAQFLLRLFFRMLRAIRAYPDPEALVKLAWSVPVIVARMDPLALSVSARRGRLPEVYEAGPYQREHALGYGVVEALSDALGGALRGGRSLSREDRGALRGAALALAAKRGLLSQLLDVASELLRGPEAGAGAGEAKGERGPEDGAGDGDDDGGAAAPLLAAPALRELAAADPGGAAGAGAGAGAAGAAGAEAAAAAELAERLRAAADRGARRGAGGAAAPPGGLEPGWLAALGDGGGLGGPGLVPELERVELRECASLGGRGVALTVDGECLAWGGDGGPGDAPGDDRRRGDAPGGGDAPPPAPAAPLGGRRCARVACGLGHVLALAADDGSVLAWGDGGNGRLGRGDAADDIAVDDERQEVRDGAHAVAEVDLPLQRRAELARRRRPQRLDTAEGAERAREASHCCHTVDFFCHSAF